MEFEVQVKQLHWIDEQNQQTDLCAHGTVTVTANGEVIATDSELTVSTGAYHMLRSLMRDHTPEKPLAEHLIPHCGHFMVLDPESGEIVNVGCSYGLNWWIQSDGEDVILRFTKRELRLSRAQWKDAVVTFSDAVRTFFENSGPRQPASHDREWWPAFLQRWDQIRARVETSTA